MLAVFSEFGWFQTKQFTGLLELLQLYKETPLEKIFIFTIYQNYTLALIFNGSTNFFVVAVTTTVVVRYCLLSDYLPKLQAEPKSRRRYVRVNKSSLVIGCFSALGLAILANFPVSLPPKPQVLHSTSNFMRHDHS